MMLTWKYTLPAFLVPFVFTLTPDGLGLLLQTGPATVLTTTVTAALGLAALAALLTGWLGRELPPAHRLLLGLAGVLLCYADARSDVAGLAISAVVLFLHFSWHPPAGSR
jgi:TRAP-type uncharacterized transport system fused permease subunit